MMVAPINPANKQAQTSLLTGIGGWVAWVIVVGFNWTLGAILSFLTVGVIGFLCTAAGYLVLIPWIIAVVTGHRSLNQIKQTGESGRGMAIAGLVMGYGGLALTLCTILFYMAGVATLITAIILAPTTTPLAP